MESIPDGRAKQILRRYPGVVSEEEMHSIENLRGIPNEISPDQS
jgi:hypothetical protein